MNLGRAAKVLGLTLGLTLVLFASSLKANTMPTTVYCCSGGSCGRTSSTACAGEAYSSKATCESNCSAN